jgi:hypothetical protein
MVCGAHCRDVGALSWTGKCGRCARERLTDNIDQMHARSGPNFDLWRRQMVACAYPGLLDVLDHAP